MSRSRRPLPCGAPVRRRLGSLSTAACVAVFAMVSCADVDVRRVPSPESYLVVCACEPAVEEGVCRRCQAEQWNRIQRDRVFLAPSAFISFAQIRRAARYLAISSKKSL